MVSHRNDCQHIFTIFHKGNALQKHGGHITGALQHDLADSCKIFHASSGKFTFFFPEGIIIGQFHRERKGPQFFLHLLQLFHGKFNKLVIVKIFPESMIAPDVVEPGDLSGTVGVGEKMGFKADSDSCQFGFFRKILIEVDDLFCQLRQLTELGQQATDQSIPAVTFSEVPLPDHQLHRDPRRRS